MIVILAALGIFQRMAKNTVDARKDAQSNAQRNAVFLAAGLNLQSAGFGIENAAWGTQVLLLENAFWNEQSQRLNESPGEIDSGNAIIWMKNIDGATMCSGLLAPATSGGLLSLETTACGSVTEWSSLAWSKSRYLNKAQIHQVTITKGAGTCSPYGVAEEDEEAKQNAIITLITDSNTKNSISHRICLANIAA